MSIRYYGRFRRSWGRPARFVDTHGSGAKTGGRRPGGREEKSKEAPAGAEESRRVEDPALRVLRRAILWTPLRGALSIASLDRPYGLTCGDRFS